jgi:hypothetical protein
VKFSCKRNLAFDKNIFNVSELYGKLVFITCIVVRSTVIWIRREYNDDLVFRNVNSGVAM